MNPIPVKTLARVLALPPCFPGTVRPGAEKLSATLLILKNNRVRLEAARRTIEELEGSRSETNAS